MARKAKCWRWVTGSHGAKVVAFERVPGGSLYLGIPRIGGGYDRESLGHTDRDIAMTQAAQLAARRQAGDGHSGPLSVAPMFALYLKSIGAKQPPVAARHLADDERSAEMWVRWLGADYKVQKFGPSEWEAFQRLRGTGEMDSRGHLLSDSTKWERMGPRTLARDLKVFRAACRRAAIERTSTGTFLLAADPTRGLVLPVEKNPQRSVSTAARFDALMAVADQVQTRIGRGRLERWEPSYFRTILRLAGDTGRRIGSILPLRWNDWRPERGAHGQIRWRADQDKVGKEWWAPVTPEVREELERFRRERPGVGEAFMFPAPNDPTKPLILWVANDWLEKAEKLAGVDPLPHGKWHPFRRRWATERKHLSPKDVAAVGGWVDTATLQKCYQQADEETMEAVVLQPRRLRKLG